MPKIFERDLARDIKLLTEKLYALKLQQTVIEEQISVAEDLLRSFENEEIKVRALLRAAFEIPKGGTDDE